MASSVAVVAALLTSAAVATAAVTGGGASSCGAVPPVWAAEVEGGGGGGGSLTDGEASLLVMALCEKLLCGIVVMVMVRRDLATELKTRRLLQELYVPYMVVPAHATRIGREWSVIHSQALFVAVASSDVAVVPKGLGPLTESWLLMTPPGFAAAVPARFNSLVLQVCHVGPRCALLRERYSTAGDSGELGGAVGCYERWESPPQLSWVPVMYIDRRYSLQGIRLRVLVQHEPPFAEYEDKWRASGFFGSLWKILETRMNFSSEMERVQGAPCGCGANCALMRRLEGGGADAALGGVSLSPEKADSALLLLPVLTVRCSVYIRALPAQSTALWSFLTPFSGRLWLSLAATVACAALALAANCRLRRHRCRCSIAGAFLDVYAIICAQGPHETACMSGAGRLVLLGVLAVATTVPAAYSAVLVSLAVRYPVLPFSDIPGLLRHGGYAVGVLRNSTEHHFFSTTSDPTMQLVYSRLMEPDPDNFPLTDTEAFQRVCENKFAYFIPEEYTYAIRDNISCKIVPLPTTHFHISLTIALTKDSPYEMLFNHNIQVLRRNGIIQKLYREWWPHREYQQDNHWEAVEMDQLVSPFGILLVGIFLASLVGAFEICWHLKYKS